MICVMWEWLVFNRYRIQIRSRLLEICNVIWLNLGLLWLKYLVNWNCYTRLAKNDLGIKLLDRFIYYSIEILSLITSTKEKRWYSDLVIYRR